MAESAAAQPDVAATQSRWALVLGDKKLVWFPTLLLCIAVLMLDRSAGLGLSTVAAVEASAAYGLVWSFAVSAVASARLAKRSGKHRLKSWAPRLLADFAVGAVGLAIAGLILDWWIGFGGFGA
jgi:hypothetical protein